MSDAAVMNACWNNLIISTFSATENRVSWMLKHANNIKRKGLLNAADYESCRRGCMNS